MINTLIVFARVPILSKVKTRLSEGIGQLEALKIYKQLLNHTLEVAKKSNVNVKIYWSESGNNSFDKVQIGNDLGERMYNALNTEYKQDRKVCLIGTDTPFITREIINTAFNTLDSNDLVFGPAKDGGYYLVGIKSSPRKQLFLNRKWSHNNVLQDALKVASQLKIKFHLMPTLIDIDTKEDLMEWLSNSK